MDENENPLACPLFSIQTLSRPCETVGGDWFNLNVEGNGTLWVIVADVTGHGYNAYLLADGLPYLWEFHRIAELRANGCSPLELLAGLGAELESILPDGVFVEASIGRFDSDGDATIAGAGNCRLLIRTSGQPTFTLHQLGGPPLGFEGLSRDQRNWRVAEDDEFMIASDGLYEQPVGENEQLESSLAGRAALHLSTGLSLHDSIVQCLAEVLSQCCQHDDITVVTMQVCSTPNG
jgi:serine phosphatase RsbU (regulator of sigma subunit)